MKKRFLTLLFSAILTIGVVGAVSSCSLFSKEQAEETKTEAVVHFDVNTDHQTNVIKDKTVAIGKRVSKPNVYILDDNPSNLQVYGWYTSKDFTEAWDFKKGRVQNDMTLYAKWVELYTVDYYVNGETIKSENVFNGDYLTEDPTIVEGFRYYGLYEDEDCTQKLDLSQPVVGNMDVYVKRSPGIYLSDQAEEGELLSGNLSDNLAAYLGSEDGISEEGWVEPYTITTTAADGTVKEEKCTYVNFGYTPTYGDGFVELARNFDITQSQIIRIWYKNLGKADTVCMYFTAMMDLENTVYSATGMNYSQAFCYPNYEGNDSARIYVKTEMSETDEWAYVDFNLYEVYKNGYSVWATSPYLGALRFQSNYKSEVSTDGSVDESNVFLIKAIEGIPCDVPVEDSVAIQEKMNAAEALTPEEINQVSNSQEPNANGFVFPKDSVCAMNATENAKLINSTEGLLFYAENEIAARDRETSQSGFTLYAVEQSIDLAESTTLQVTLRNYGYATSLSAFVYNKQGGFVSTTFTIGAQMPGSKTYSINLYGKSGMKGELDKIEFIYTSLGTDNLIVFEGVSFGGFTPYDIVGINFNDKLVQGFASTEKVNVSFNANYAGTLFEVAEDGAAVTTVKPTYQSMSDGYAYATLEYLLYPNGSMTAVNVQYKIGGNYTSAYRYVLDQSTVGKVSSVKLPLKAEERGLVQGLRFSFEGAGSIVIREIQYVVSESSLPYYESYAAVFAGGWAGWNENCQYVYDNELQASTFVNKGDSKTFGTSMYIGETKKNGYVPVPHQTMNVLMTETSIVKVVYQNKTNMTSMGFVVRFSNYDNRSSEDEGVDIFHDFGSVSINAKMGEYEWAVATFEIPAEYAGKYLAKIRMTFEGEEFTIRAISIETGEE